MVAERKDAMPEAAFIRVIRIYEHTHFLKLKLSMHNNGFSSLGNIGGLENGSAQDPVMFFMLRIILHSHTNSFTSYKTGVLCVV